MKNPYDIYNDNRAYFGYERGYTEGVDGFADYVRKNFRIGINTIEELAEEFKKKDE